MVGAVKNEVANLKINGASSIDVDKFKAEYKLNHELQLSNNNYWLSYLASQLGNNENLLQVLGYQKVLNQVTPTSLKKAAIKYFKEYSMIRFDLLPEHN